MSFRPLLFALSALVCFNIAAPARAENGQLVVDISGLKNDAGVVRVALYNNEQDYKADKKNTGEKAFNKEAVPIKGQHAVCTFSNVPYGDYAIKFFHDEDNSGNFVTGMFGIPKVEYGFSNNARGMMGPASYEKAKFNLHQSEMTLKLDTK
jgi:uncharacterized protein (DUF2141 family)